MMVTKILSNDELMEGTGLSREELSEVFKREGKIRIRIEETLYNFYPVVGEVRAGKPLYIDGKIYEWRGVPDTRGDFWFRVKGDSMIGSGIFPGDYLLVDRKLDPKSGDIVVASVDGELTVKRYRIVDGRAYLIPENRKYEWIKMDKNTVIVGVVVHLSRDM